VMVWAWTWMTVGYVSVEIMRWTAADFATVPTSMTIVSSVKGSIWTWTNVASVSVITRQRTVQAIATVTPNTMTAAPVMDPAWCMRVAAQKPCPKAPAIAMAISPIAKASVAAARKSMLAANAMGLPDHVQAAAPMAC